LAALVIAAVAVKEGIGAWRGDMCCTVPVTVSVDDLAAASEHPACGRE